MRAAYNTILAMTGVDCGVSSVCAGRCSAHVLFGCVVRRPSKTAPCSLPLDALMVQLQHLDAVGTALLDATHLASSPIVTCKKATAALLLGPVNEENRLTKSGRLR